MELEFTHAIDLNELKKDIGKTVEEIASECGLNPQALYKWSWSKANNGVRPKYNTLKKLLEMGASTETLFGVTIKPKQAEASQDQIMEQVKKALKDLIQK